VFVLVGVNVAPTGVLVTVGVLVGVLVRVDVLVFVGVNVAPTGVLVIVGVLVGVRVAGWVGVAVVVGVLVTPVPPVGVLVTVGVLVLVRVGGTGVLVTVIVGKGAPCIVRVKSVNRDGLLTTVLLMSTTSLSRVTGAGGENCQWITKVPGAMAHHPVCATR